MSGGKSSSIEFFTISKSGITYNYGKQTDFTTIEQFEREHAGFHKILKIRFFRRYRKWKNFTFWKKNVRNSKIQSAKRRLKKTLFILSDEFANPLLETTKYVNNFIRLYKKKAKDNINNINSMIQYGEALMKIGK